MSGSIKGAFEVHVQGFQLKLMGMVAMSLFRLPLPMYAAMEEVKDWDLTVHNTRDGQQNQECRRHSDSND